MVVTGQGVKTDSKGYMNISLCGKKVNEEKDKSGRSNRVYS